MSLQISSLRQLYQNPNLFTQSLDNPTISPLIKFHFLQSTQNPWQALIDGKFKFIEHYIAYLKFQKLQSSTPLHDLFKQTTILKNNPILLNLVKEILEKLHPLSLKTIRSFIALKDENNQTIFDLAIWNNRADIIKYLLNTFYSPYEKFEILSFQNFNTKQTIFHIFASNFNIFDVLNLLDTLTDEQRNYIINLREYFGRTFIEIWNERDISIGQKL
jgi:hypothetical protein